MYASLSPSSQSTGYGNLLDSLPACRRCRANKRRCDIQLPSCHNCLKAGAECIFFDHVLGEDLPRSYIASLIHNIEQLRLAVQTQTDVPDNPLPTVENSSGALIAPQTRPLLPPRYMGPLSCLSQGLNIRGQEYIFDKLELSPKCPIPPFEYDLEVKADMHQFLIQTYLDRIHQFYPILDSTLPPLTQSFASIDQLHPSENFILQMVYSIAGHCSPGDRTQLQGLADRCHSCALQQFDITTADLNISTLRAITLLALHSLFDPRQGNTGQLIGFAARLVVDIGANSDNGQEKSIRDIQAAIFCMDNKFATALDRPSFLPEPVYPIGFDINKPAHYLCSLYRIQSRFHNGFQLNDCHRIIQAIDTGSLQRQLANHRQSIPDLLSVVYETQLLLDPKPSKAAQLLSCYAHPQSTHTFLSAHWAYHAGMILLEEKYVKGVARPEFVSAFRSCIVVLERGALKWESAAAFGESINSYIAMKESTLDQHANVCTQRARYFHEEEFDIRPMRELNNFNFGAMKDIP